MNRRCPIALVALLPLASTLAATRPADAQETQAAPQLPQKFADSTERLRTYLAHNPYHEKTFEDLVAASVLFGGASVLIDHYRSLPESPAQIVLARLLARDGDVTAALAELPPSVGIDAWLLRARLLNLDGQHAAATAELDLALRASSARKDRERVLHAKVELSEINGDREAERAALLSLGELAPEDFAAVAASARRLATAHFTEDALHAYERALDLAGDDAASHTSLIAEYGPMLEDARRGREALALYDEAVALLKHGHWMRADLFARATRLRRVSGTLAPWLEEQRALAEQTGELEDWLDVAVALAESDRSSQALEVLVAVRETHPDDELLGELILGTAARAERTEGVAREWQRRTAARPEAPEGWLALAAALEAEGAREAAVRALTKAEDASNESSELAQVAAAWRALERYGDVVRVLERVAQQSPNDATPLTDVALAAFKAGDAQAAIEVAQRAEQLATADNYLLVAETWRKVGDVDRAKALLDRATQDDELQVAALQRLAVVLEESEDLAGALEALRRAASAAEGTTRSRCARLYAERVGAAKDAEAFRQAEANLEPRASQDPAATLLLAHLARKQKQASRAIEHWRTYLDRVPSDTAARSDLVGAMSSSGHLQGALDELDEMIALEPANAARLMLRKASIARDRSMRVDALGWLAEVRRRARHDPELLRRLAARYEAYDEPELAIESLRASLRLEPDATAANRRLSRLLALTQADDAAQEHWERAWRLAEDRKTRAAFVDQRYRTHRDDIEALIAELVDRARTDPFDADAPDLAVQFLFRDRRYEDANELLATLLVRCPERNDWHVMATRARIALGEPAGGDFERIVARAAENGGSLEEVLFELKYCGDIDAVAAVGRLMKDPLPAAKTLIAGNDDLLGAALLSAHAKANGLGSDALLDELAKLFPYIQPDARFALEVLEALQARDGPTIVRTYRIGALHSQLRHAQETRDAAAQLRELGAPGAMIDGFEEHFVDSLERRRDHAGK